MINFNFSFANPWSNRWECIVNKSGLVGNNKAWEANLYRTNHIVSIDFSLSFRGDHAGVRISGGVLGFEGEFHLYDRRHWDYDKNDWVKYD
jgi:hypothetical protein